LNSKAQDQIDVNGYIFGPIYSHEDNIDVTNMSWVDTQLLLLQGHVYQAIANCEAIWNIVFHLCITHKYESPLCSLLDGKFATK